VTDDLIVTRKRGGEQRRRSQWRAAREAVFVRLEAAERLRQSAQRDERLVNEHAASLIVCVNAVTRL
jgi:hypothetical protein